MRFLLLLALVAIALAIQAPASLIAREVLDSSMGSVRLLQPTGTIWRGQADLVVGTPVAARTAITTASNPLQIAVGPVRWNVERFDVSRRALILSVRQPPLPQVLTVTVAGDRIEASGNVRIPAEISSASPLLAGWTLTGEIDIATPVMQSTAAGVAGTAIAVWRNAKLIPPDLPGGFALGEVSANATFAGQLTGASVRNSGGDVELTVDASAAARTIGLIVQPRASASSAQLGWLQSHTMGRTPRGFRIDLGWPGR